MKTAGVFLLVLAALVTVIIVIGGVVRYNTLVSDTDSWKARAQVAGDAGDILEYLQNYRGGLEKHRATSGHWVLIFKRPENDFALHTKSVTQLEARLAMLQELDHASTAYQSGLDDVRGTIRELPNIASPLFKVRHWLWGVLLVLGWIAVILTAIALGVGRSASLVELFVLVGIVLTLLSIGFGALSGP